MDKTLKAEEALLLHQRHAFASFLLVCTGGGYPSLRGNGILSDVQCEELCGSVLPSGGNTWPGNLRYSQNLTIYVRRILTWCHS